MDSFSKLSNLFVERRHFGNVTFWEFYEEFQRDVLELTLNQRTEGDPIPVLLAKKIVRNLKRSKFPNNHLIDEGVAHLSGYILVAVVLESVAIDEITKRYCTDYFNFMYNAKYKIIMSYELNVEEMHYLQTRLTQCLGGGGCP
jgi:hypothetical protein